MVSRQQIIREGVESSGMCESMVAGLLTLVETSQPTDKGVCVTDFTDDYELHAAVFRAFCPDITEEEIIAERKNFDAIKAQMLQEAQELGQCE